MRRAAILASLITLAGCAESDDSCDEGFARDPEGECVPFPPDGGRSDAGRDAEVDVDAGPCGGECTGTTPVCDETSGDCVQCTEDDASECEGTTPFCDTASNTCVVCLGDADCTDLAAARCDEGTCTGCDDSAQCASITGTQVCNTGENLCVECTETEAGACGGNPCTASNTCSAYGTDQRTCESCDTDANCANADHYCVPMQYMGSDRPGGYCLKDVTAGCEQPYSVATVQTTLSGATGMTFCGINETLATCEAVRALHDDQMCPTGMDSECPEGGLCRTVGVLVNRCTYQCGLAAQCPSDAPADTCGAGTPANPPDHCGGG